MIPNAHISFLLEYPLFYKHCGLMYNGVPTREFLSKASVELAASFAKPKSPILKTPLWMKIFAGLRSLCRIFYFNSWLKPQIISPIISRASYSGKNFRF